MNTSVNAPPAELDKSGDIINYITQNIAFNITSLFDMPSINRTHYWPPQLDVSALAEAGISRGHGLESH